MVQLNRNSATSEPPTLEVADKPVIDRQASRRARSESYRRDWLILPLLSLLTVGLLFAAAEAGTRVFWSAEDKGYCMAFDPVEGPHARPNCTSIEKIPEGREVVEHFNECGYRSDSPCGPKAAGVGRIALLGSSIAEGYVIPYGETVGAVMTRTLQSQCGRSVELENLGAEACLPIYSYRHVSEAMRLHPDVAILIVNPWDLEQDVDPKLLAVRDLPVPVNRAPAPEVHLSFVQHIQLLSHSSRALAVAQHYMLQNRRTFLNIYLNAGGDHGAFVRTPFSPAWEQRFAVTDLLVGEMAEKFRAAGIAFMLIAVPERAQVLMLDEEHLPPHVDPWAFTRRLGEIAARNHILYVDALKVFSIAPGRDNLFYIMDGHPTPEAQQLIGKAAAAEIVAAHLPTFDACGQRNPGMQ